jgi:TolA-binding protein
MSMSENTTTPLDPVLKAIADLRIEVTRSIGDLRSEMNQRFDQIESRLAVIERDIASLKGSILSMSELFSTHLADHERRLRKVEEAQRPSS